MTQENMKRVAELEAELASKIQQRKELQKKIQHICQTIANIKCYDKYYKSTVRHNRGEGAGKTAIELYGKHQKDLTPEDLDELQSILDKKRRQ